MNMVPRGALAAFHTAGPNSPSPSQTLRRSSKACAAGRSHRNSWTPSPCWSITVCAAVQSSRLESIDVRHGDEIKSFPPARQTPFPERPVPASPDQPRLPFRRRERAMLRFRQMKGLQKFASVHANVHNHFSLERHLVDRQTYKQRRSAAFAESQSLASRSMPFLNQTPATRERFALV